MVGILGGATFKVLYTREAGSAMGHFYTASASTEHQQAL